MIIKITVGLGANIHSANAWEVTPQDLGFDTDEEWQAADEEEKHRECALWAWNNGLEIYYEEKSQ